MKKLNKKTSIICIIIFVVLIIQWIFSNNVYAQVFSREKSEMVKNVISETDDIFKKYNLPEMTVNSTCQFENQLFIGTDSGLIVINENNVVQNIPVSEATTLLGKKIGINDLVEGLEGRKIKSIIRDSKGKLWISTWSEYGLICYDGDRVICFRKADGMISDQIRVVSEKVDGSILVACNGGVVVLKDGQIVNVYDEIDGIKNLEVLTVSEANNGDIIIGTNGDGIYVISDNSIKHLGSEDGLKSDIVMKVKKDINKEFFWIVTNNSIAYMDKDFNIITIEKFPISNCYDIYENKMGDIWILASNGIYITKAMNLLANGEISTFFLKRNSKFLYTTENSYSDLTEKGILYISGIDGVIKVNIEEPLKEISFYIEEQDYFYQICLALVLILIIGIAIFHESCNVNKEYTFYVEEHKRKKK